MFQNRLILFTMRQTKSNSLSDGNKTMREEGVDKNISYELCVHYDLSMQDIICEYGQCFILFYYLIVISCTVLLVMEKCFKTTLGFHIPSQGQNRQENSIWMCILYWVLKKACFPYGYAVFLMMPCTILFLEYNAF